MKKIKGSGDSPKTHPSTTRTLTAVEKRRMGEESLPNLPTETERYKKYLAAIAFGVSAAVGVAMCRSDKTEEPAIVETRSVATPVSPKTTVKPVILEKKEVLLENKERIDQLEEAFIKFAQKISENAKIYSNPAESALVGIPLEVVKGNRDNKEKDLSKFANLIKDGKAVSFELKSLKHFHYSFAKMEEGRGANYFDPNREVILNSDFSVENIKDLFFLYHELIHAKEDEIRKAYLEQGKLRRYPETLLFMTKAPVPATFLEDEVRANGITLMAMNAYFKGKLAALGEKAFAEDIAELFGVSLEGATKVSTDYIDLVTMQTRVFYNSKANQKDRALEWRSLVASMYVNAGKKLYGIDENGAPFPLTNP
jgi:hypothetical protein